MKEINILFEKNSNIYSINITKNYEWEIKCSCHEKNYICSHIYSIINGNIESLTEDEQSFILEHLEEIRKDLGSKISKELFSKRISKNIIKLTREKLNNFKSLSEECKDSSKRDFYGALLSKDGTPVKSTVKFFTKPVPPIYFLSATYCFTGVFAYGEKKDCQTATARKGAIIKKDLTQDVDFLVVGSIASAGWAKGNYGRKIERALELGINIISEDTWAAALTDSSCI